MLLHASRAEGLECMATSSEAEPHSDSERNCWQEVQADRADHMVWASHESSDSEPDDRLLFPEKVVHQEPQHLFWNSIGVPCAIDGLKFRCAGSAHKIPFGLVRRPPNDTQVNHSYLKQLGNPPASCGDGLTSGGEADLDVSQSDACDAGDLVTSGSEAPSRKAKRERFQDSFPVWKKRLPNQVTHSRRLRGESWAPLGTANAKGLERTVLHTLWDSGFSTDEDAETCATAEEDEGNEEYSVQEEALPSPMSVFHL
ncbi:unnamed protein product [Cladocopium goreaui]|uniref:Uncharacterized protein n=1 Tax=Cladocopium goreaui TaxID=2562237 RepID=A0A9P1FFF5_9DINO|nr:unnamed protein product [Cladocopium goreaui]